MGPTLVIIIIATIMCFKHILLLVVLILYARAQSFEQHPMNTTVCQGDNATFTCAVSISSGSIPQIGWLRNGVNVDMMRHIATTRNNRTGNNASPAYIEGTVTVINVRSSDNGVQYQCGIVIFLSSNATLSVAVPPMTAPSITEITPLSNTSFTVSWTITDPDHNYIVAWTNLRTGMMSNVTVPEKTNSYVVTGLNDVDNYSVTVTANNSCGMMMSDPATVYDKPNAVINVTIRDDVTSESFVVLWDVVMDNFTITYNVTWYNDSGIIGMDTVNSPPYTVTGLTANTSYNVTIVAINTCCGAGPVSVPVQTMTNGEPPTTVPSTSPPTTNLTTSLTTLPPTLNFIPQDGGCPVLHTDPDSSSISDVVIACGITFILTLITTAVITFVLTYIFVKRKLASTGKQPVATAKTAVSPSSQADLEVQPNPAYGVSPFCNKTALEVQPNPAYGTSQKTSMNTNPAYEICK